jgi:large subunit ribosomal protein L7Ae
MKTQKKRAPQPKPYEKPKPKDGKKVVKKTDNPLIEKKPRNFGIGNDIQPKKDLYRFVRWPRYVRLQRQRRVLYKRLKVPPAINQFTKVLDKNTATQLFKLLVKYKPEDKLDKKKRLLELAKAKVESTKGEKAAKDKKDKKGDKKPITIKYGLNHVTALVEAKETELVVIAHDVDPIELVVWLPALCRRMDVPYVIVKGKERLGKLVRKKTAAVIALTAVKNEDKQDLGQLVTLARSNFNERFDDNKKSVGGGLVGNKALQARRKLEKAIAKEEALKAKS